MTKLNIIPEQLRCFYIGPECLSEGSVQQAVRNGILVESSFGKAQRIRIIGSLFIIFQQPGINNFVPPGYDPELIAYSVKPAGPGIANPPIINKKTFIKIVTQGTEIKSIQFILILLVAFLSCKLLKRSKVLACKYLVPQAWRLSVDT
ncbi:hypothetical protein B0I18_101110 [Taibaiella chishuiensis]|uniref:Uncharacterized protein n=1 Tax=Taibaiella chishuiensis TaxID=1434707 RepID=A0A2P8D9V5_9BACT|nr:hypothetical protein B0I18_101110 [Taibaiella chishuiensis]